jgi:hypothetical protein
LFNFTFARAVVTGNEFVSSHKWIFREAKITKKACIFRSFFKQLFTPL